MNAIHLNHVKNMAILTYKGVYSNLNELKEDEETDFSLVILKEDEDPSDFEHSKWIGLT